jgi:hypothetical protein
VRARLSGPSLESHPLDPRRGVDYQVIEIYRFGQAK